MFYSNNPRVHYDRAQLTEVICQLRFPTILAIGAKEPVDFQDAIRSAFPLYTATQDQLAPKIVGLGTANPRVEPQPPVTNYRFTSKDGIWRLNLTSSFISLTTNAYPGWEDFGQHFDLPLASLIRIYQPAFFERIGLRYVNIFSRKALELEDEPWRNLFSPLYLGAMAEEEITEKQIRRCSVDMELDLDGSSRVKIHAGPGMVKPSAPNVPQDPEVKFVLDMDLSMAGQVDPRMAAAGLETLHAHSTPLFQGAITDTLHIALEPQQ